ncbi:uncharacterized protein [Garra rufa]|uniref:uncharacterized protein n=1 Tax=Garra rufa TaxID=137080 RepID=UPI003CCE7EFF
MREINGTKQKKQEENLSVILADTLKGLEKLEPFLDAMEKLTLTSRHVFSKKIFLLRGKSPESVQSVINAARIDAPILILFKRNAETFFQPLLHNVDVMVFQLNIYIDKTEHLCRRIRQNLKMDGLRSVQLILNVSENAMYQMHDHLIQLCQIREDQDIRVAFLFQENAEKFIDVYSERRFRMWEFLSDLEDAAVHLDRMKIGASISSVAGSSVGILGRVLSFTGIHVSNKSSLGLTLAGVSLEGLSSLVKGLTELFVNSHHMHNVQESLKRYTDDVEMILECKDKAASFKWPLIGHRDDSNMKVLNSSKDIVGSIVDVTEASSEYKKGEIAEKDSSTKAVNISTTGTLISLDIRNICKESASLAKGSKSETSQYIQSRAVLWKSEMETWEKIYDSLRKAVNTITETQDILEKPFLPNLK